MTTVRAGLLGEDAIIFDQPLPYSIKTDERCVVLRTPTEDAKKWPIDIHNALKMKSLDKYKVFYTQVHKVQQKLNTYDNKHILLMETKMQKRV